MHVLKMCGHLAISSYATPGELERKGGEKSERLALHAAKGFARWHVERFSSLAIF